MTLSELFTNIANAIRGKDGTTATITPTDFPDRISAIETGVQLPTLSNPGAAGDLRSGKQLIGQDGSTIDGSLSEVTQATPGISVSSSGLITASVAQSGGIVSSGTKSATKQLTTQAGKTVTPGTSAQTAVSIGVYTTGDVTVAGDSNLVAGNIKSGVSIFGVVGSLAPGVKSFSLSYPAEYWKEQLSFADYYLSSRTYTDGALIISPSNLNGTINKVECIYIEGNEVVGGASAEGWYGNSSISISGFGSKATVGYAATNGGAAGDLYAIVSSDGTKIALVVSSSYIKNYFPDTEPIVIHVLYS